MSPTVRTASMLATVLVLSGCPGPGGGPTPGGGPDLVVRTFEVTGAGSVNSDNSAVLPVRAIIRNRGNAPAEEFKVSVDYTDPEGREFVVAFTAPGETDIWYPHTDGTLAARDEVEFQGNLTFHPSLHGVTVSLRTTADSCSGDEFMPPHCRVEETNEANNRSAPLSAALP